MVDGTMNYRMSENVDGLFKALSAAQKVMTGALKDAANPFFKSKYADLSSVWDACRAPLADNGLSILQPVSADGDKVTVSTILAHESGQWVASDLTMTSVKSDPQGLGSCITYARRYALSAMVGVAPEEDDGNRASGATEKASRGPHNKAQEEVIERKLRAEVVSALPPKPIGSSRPEPTGKVPPPNVLKSISDLKPEIGETLYLGALAKFGVKSAAEIQDMEKANAVYKYLGGIRKLTVAASHGEILPGIDRAFFEALPESSRAAVFVEIRNKIATACGSRDTATEEYERLRENCSTQFELFSALQRAHEFYSKQGQKEKTNAV